VIAVFVTCRLFLAATFLISGSAKFVSGGDQLANALSLSVPRRLARVGAVAVTPLEFLIAALLLFGDARTFEIGLVGSAALLIVFSAWMVSVLFRGLQVRCSCFGPNGAAVSWRSVARNLALVAVAVVGLASVSNGSDPLGSSLWSGLALAGAALLLIFGIAVRRALPALALSLEQVSGAVNEERKDAYAG
jgi:hypothetical protein